MVVKSLYRCRISKTNPHRKFGVGRLKNNFIMREYKAKLEEQLSPIHRNLRGEPLDDTWYYLYRAIKTAAEVVEYESRRQRHD